MVCDYHVKIKHANSQDKTWKRPGDLKKSFHKSEKYFSVTFFSPCSVDNTTTVSTDNKTKQEDH